MTQPPQTQQPDGNDERHGAASTPPEAVAAQHSWPAPSPTNAPHDASSGVGGGSAAPQQGPATSGALRPPVPEAAPHSPGHNPAARRQRGGWGKVAGAAAIAAVLASGGTALLTGAFAASEQSASSPPGTPPAVTTDVAHTGDAASPAWRPVADAVRDSVVAIDVATPRGEGAGSGVIIDQEGNILTNAHVITGAGDGMVNITLADGRMLQASVIGSDPTTDMAVVRLTDPPQDLKPATLGGSAKLSVGDPVLAVGNPLGLDSTVTTGIISALNRPVVTRGAEGDDAVVTNAIQVDAAINPGNSGGPLFDADGRVIGINSSIASLSGGSEAGSIGLGFAIPIDQAQQVTEQLIADGRAQHAFLGVSLTDSTATADDVTRQGAKVEQVEGGSPADEAGLQAGDVITTIEGASVDGAASLTGYVRQHSTGDVIALDIVRAGQTSTLEATLDSREAAAAD